MAVSELNDAGRRRRRVGSVRWVTAAVAVLLAVPLAAVPSGAQADGEGAEGAVPTLISAGSVTVTILHNNDGESKLLPDVESGFPGVARFVAAMRELQAAAAADGPVVTLTSGDNFLASLELGVSLDRGGPHVRLGRVERSV